MRGARASPPPVPPDPPSDSGLMTLEELPRAWATPGGDDVGPGCMRLDDGGRLRFSGAFGSLRSGSWRYRAYTGELVLTLPQLAFDSATVEALEGFVAHGDLQSFDASQRALHYRLDRRTPALNVLGWNFFRPEHIRAQGIELGIPCEAQDSG